MAAWRSTVILATALVWVNPLAAQPYLLSEDPLAGKFFRIELDMSLKGEMKLRQEDKPLAFKQSAAAQHQFIERILETDKNGLPTRSARIYHKAQAVIHSGDVRSERSFRSERPLIACQRIDEQAFCFSPKGSLTREEVDLTEHFDTLTLSALLPGKKVNVGDSWEIANAAVQGLCYLDGLAGHDLKGTLQSVSNGVAVVAVKGTANGIDLGAAIKITINAVCKFDVKNRVLTAADWTQSDAREQGPVSPELNFELTTRVKRTLIEPVNELNDLAVVPLPTAPKPPETMTRIFSQDPDKRYEIDYAREWKVVARTDKHLVMRLLDRGDFVAQVTITPWTKAEPGEHLSTDEFQMAMDNIPGWQEDESLEAGEIPSNNDNWIYRIAAAGTLNDVKVVQYFYLVAGPQGDQAVFVFTMAPAQTQKLGAHDLDLVRSLAFPRGVAGRLTSSAAPAEKDQ